MQPVPAPAQRLLSLDFMRGFIMVLLALEAAGLYHHLAAASEGSAIHFFFRQFFHHPWNGLYFWDLIQPAFMFMAGTAMAYSLTKQLSQGVSWNEAFLKALKRSGWLFFWGVLDYAVRKDGLSFELWDVLTQLSFTLLVAFLIFQWSYTTQFLISIGLLVITELVYRFTNVPNFDQPFVDQHNFGNYVDWILMRKINGDGWVAINCVPTAAHTIWGAMCGKLLLSNETAATKLKWMILAGIVFLIVGYSMDWTITPIIKRIATSSFVVASGGWCLLGLALCYYWIDVKDHKRFLTFFIVVGMNSIFMYLFFEIVGHRWFNEYIGTITNGLMGFIDVPEYLMQVVTSLCIFGLEWGMCYFLYRKKIFFRL